MQVCSKSDHRILLYFRVPSFVKEVKAVKKPIDDSMLSDVFQSLESSSNQLINSINSEKDPLSVAKSESKEEVSNQEPDWLYFEFEIKVTKVLDTAPEVLLMIREVTQIIRHQQRMCDSIY